MKKIYYIFLFGCLFFIQKSSIIAQIADIFYVNVNKTLDITFYENINAIDGITVASGVPIPCPLIYYRDEITKNRVLLYCDVEVIPRTIKLKNFRTTPVAIAGNPADDLVTGANPASPDFLPIPPGENRNYYIQLESVLINGRTEPILINTSKKLNSELATPPILKVIVDKTQRDKLSIHPYGITVTDLVNIFKSKPNLITVVFSFSDDDPALDFKTSATSIEQDLSDPKRAIITLANPLPDRPEDYDAVVNIPWANLRGQIVLTADWAFPPLKKPEDDFLSGSDSVEKSIPKSPDRKNSEFSFESAFTSIVKPSVGKRNNVGVFGLYFKPTIKTFSFDTESGKKKPSWISLRPLFEADVDTQPIKDSEAPNRIQFGFDVEFGKVLGYDFDKNNKLTQKGFFRQFVWTNGLRYDSDRDFKLQTMYWHTEFAPVFKNFERNFSQRLFWFKKTKSVGDVRKEPFVSSYYVRPSFGYELGGTIRRNSRDLTTPTKNISRAFFRLGMSLELQRLFKVSVDDTYYYLQNAFRRTNRNYIETTLEFNLGRLAKYDLNGFSNSIFLKFQGGEQPPDFGRINSFSIGFKIFK